MIALPHPWPSGACHLQANPTYNSRFVSFNIDYGYLFHNFHQEHYIQTMDWHILQALTFPGVAIHQRDLVIKFFLCIFYILVAQDAAC